MLRQRSTAGEERAVGRTPPHIFAISTALKPLGKLGWH